MEQTGNKKRGKRKRISERMRDILEGLIAGMWLRSLFHHDDDIKVGKLEKEKDSHRKDIHDEEALQDEEALYDEEEMYDEYADEEDADAYYDDEYNPEDPDIPIEDMDYDYTMSRMDEDK